MQRPAEMSGPHLTLRGKTGNRVSEIPCRVSNIARGGSNPVQTTGSNRWSPHGALQGGRGEYPGEDRHTTIPVTTQGLRSLDGITRFHNTPALINLMDLSSYISGFVDGEGCFCVSFQPSKRHKFGWEVRPSFSVSQNADRAELLYMIQNRWGCGFIRPDRSDKTIKFE